MPRAHAAHAAFVMIISIILAGVFLLAGVPKIVGMETVALQAASMNGFPAWIRVIVGIVEVVGAIALLVPSVATFAALALAFVMIPATLTQYASGEPGLYVPIVLLALLLFVAWRRNPALVHKSYHDFADQPHPLLHDGIYAGLIGAAVIAIWFFVVDFIAGHPFFTPRTLGNGLIQVLGPGSQHDGPVAQVLVYSVFHFGAFMIVGVAASLVVWLAKSEPSILLGFVVLFVATEVGFYALVGLLREATPLGNLAWYQVMIGNILAAVAMGIYFWRTHRELADEFRHSLDFDKDLVPPEYRSSIPSPSQTPGVGADARARDETKNTV
jgi:putative oxidoreductase